MGGGSYIVHVVFPAEWVIEYSNWGTSSVILYLRVAKSVPFFFFFLITRHREERKSLTGTLIEV